MIVVLQSVNELCRFVSQLYNMLVNRLLLFSDCKYRHNKANFQNPF